MRRLSLVIKQRWETLADSFIAKYPDATAAEMRSYLDESLTSESSNYITRWFWTQSSPEEKSALLAELIPDGHYTEGGWVLATADGQILQQDWSLSKNKDEAEWFPTSEKAEEYKAQLRGPEIDVRRLREVN